MGYFFLALSNLCGSVKGFCGKKASGLTRGFSGAAAANMIRMFLCVIIGAVLVTVESPLKFFKLPLGGLGICVLSGISTAAFVLLWMVSVRTSAYMLTNVFILTGVLVPLIGCRFLYGEEISWIRWAGIGIAFGAVLLMCSYNNSIKVKLRLRDLLFLLLCGLSNGMTEFSQKIINHDFPQISNAVFNFYTYLVSFGVLAVFFLILRLKQPGEGSGLRESIRKTGVLIAIMAAALFGHSFFQTAAAGELDAAILFPMNQGISLIASSIISAIFFKEKLTLKCIVSMILIFAALIIINIG